jgi:hypothetical protein
MVRPGAVRYDRQVEESMTRNAHRVCSFRTLISLDELQHGKYSRALSGCHLSQLQNGYGNVGGGLRGLTSIRKIGNAIRLDATLQVAMLRRNQNQALWLPCADSPSNETLQTASSNLVFHTVLLRGFLP